MENLKVFNYDASYGEKKVTDEMIATLTGLPIEEQIKFFKANVGYYAHSIADDSDFKGVIVDNGIIVGVMLSDWACSLAPCFVGDSVCTWDSEDNNGAGYKTRTEYTSLHFVK